MRRWWWPSASRCWRRCFPAASISASAARPAPTAPRRMRCAAGSIAARATISSNGCSELMLWETRDFPAGHPYNNVVAMPDDTPLPPIWLLGSSDYSSELAAQVGMGFAFAHHFASYDAVEAMTQLPQPLQAVRLARDAARHSRGRCGCRRNRCGSRKARLLDGPQPPAPRPRTISAAAERRGSAGLSLHATPSAPRSRATARGCSSAAPRRSWRSCSR